MKRLIVDLSRLDPAIIDDTVRGAFSQADERRRLWVRHGGPNPWIDLGTMSFPHSIAIPPRDGDPNYPIVMTQEGPACQSCGAGVGENHSSGCADVTTYERIAPNLWAPVDADFVIPEKSSDE